jgi:phosphopantothenoylcysteine decarboxylase/phosphopantothenate--cysteine ligase
MRKGCDWIVANDVSPGTDVMGGDCNTVHLLTRDGVGGESKAESFPVMTKEEVAAMLIARIVSTVTDSPT